MTELEQLGQFLDLLRLKGVKSFKGGIAYDPNSGWRPIDVELGLSVDNVEDAKPFTAASPDNCRCGHLETMHTNGFCLQGCDIEKCAGSPIPEIK